MKKTMQKLLLAVFAASMLAACSSDKEQAKLNPEQAKDAMASASEALLTDISDFESAPGFTAFNDLSSYSGAPLPFRTAKPTEKDDPRVLIRQTLHQLRHSITAPTSNERVTSEEQFDFAANYGIYQWNGEFFAKTNAVVNYIQVEFPTEGSNTNNAILKLTAYSEQEVSYDDDFGTYTYYEPTRVAATLTVDGTLEASIDMEASYDENTGETLYADVTYFVNPFTLTVFFDNTSETSTSFNQSLSRSGNVIIAWGITVNFSDNTKVEPSAIVGFLQLREVRFDAAITAPSTPGGEPTFSIVVTVNGAIAGNIILDIDPSTGEEVPYIQYTDGSSEPLANVLGDLAEEIDLLLNS